MPIIFLERLHDLHGHHIYYHHKEPYDGALEFDGIPFVTTGSFFLMCEFGKYIARNRPSKVSFAMNVKLA